MNAILKKFIFNLRTINNNYINIFSDVKVLKNRIFNILGCQILRIFIFHIILRIKRKIFFQSNDYKKIISQVQELENKGYLIFENFLEKENFKNFKENFNAKLNIKNQNDNDKYKNQYSVSRLALNIENTNNLKDPWYKKILETKDLNRIIEYTTSKKLLNMKKTSIHLEKIFQTENKKSLPVDPNNYFHRDTFYRCLKFIYYMNEVSINDGPFSYIEKSNNISPWKIKVEYLASLRKKKNKNINQKDISFDMNKFKIRDFCLRENSLILVDVSGFHRRLPTKINKSRETLRFSSREHPFSITI